MAFLFTMVSILLGLGVTVLLVVFQMLRLLAVGLVTLILLALIGA